MSQAAGQMPLTSVGHIMLPQGYPRAGVLQQAQVSGQAGLSTGAFPTATFSQNFLATGPLAGASPTTKRKIAPAWSPPVAPSSDMVGEMREAVKSTDWQQLFLETRTKFLVGGGWSADSQRCGLLQTLAAVSGARRVLEIGQCCGVATLAMAEVLPADASVVTLEIDPFLADFAKQFWARSEHGHKIRSVVGPAMEYLASDEALKDSPFDLVVIDADKDNMWNYYWRLKQGLLAEKATIILDTTPYKGQPPDRYVKYGATEKWESNSGQAAIEDALQKFAQEETVSMASFAGVTVLYPRPAGNA